MDEKEYEVTITEEKIVLGADDFSYRDISAKELVPVKERRNSR